jgi:hypothetical protein
LSRQARDNHQQHINQIENLKKRGRFFRTQENCPRWNTSSTRAQSMLCTFCKSPPTGACDAILFQIQTRKTVGPFLFFQLSFVLRRFPPRACVGKFNHCFPNANLTFLFLFLFSFLFYFCFCFRCCVLIQHQTQHWLPQGCSLAAVLGGRAQAELVPHPHLQAASGADRAAER